MGEWDLGAAKAERSSVGEMPCAGLDLDDNNNKKHPPKVRVNVT